MTDQQNDIIKKEEELLKKEERIVKEERKLVAEERRLHMRLLRDVKLAALLVVLVLAAGIAVAMFVRSSSSRISIDSAQISAPSIDLAPTGSGTLQEVYVREGDEVRANEAVARVGNELVKTTVAGRVISVHDDIGKLFNRGEPVVTMIDPNALRVVVRVDEDKGLKDIRVGQTAQFTVDAFGGRTYVGTVDEISPTSRSSDVVFSVSDKREVKQFDVKIRFDIDAYPELKNGMSAKVSIFKN